MSRFGRVVGILASLGVLFPAAPALGGENEPNDGRYAPRPPGNEPDSHDDGGDIPCNAGDPNCEPPAQGGDEAPSDENRYDWAVLHLGVAPKLGTFGGIATLELGLGDTKEFYGGLSFSVLGDKVGIFGGGLQLALGLAETRSFTGGFQLGAVSRVDEEFLGLAQIGILTRTDGRFQGLLQLGGTATVGDMVEECEAEDCQKDTFSGALQVGLLASTRGRVIGLAQVGAVAYTGGTIYAPVQAGLVAHAREYQGILQFGVGLASARKFQGLAQVGVVTMGETHTGLQLGVVNLVKEEQNGAQVGVANFASEKENGVQLGVTNYARRLTGVQVGLFNRTDSLHGVQLGLANYARSGGMVPFSVIVNVGFGDASDEFEPPEPPPEPPTPEPYPPEVD
jgi:hypothetical protein